MVALGVPASSIHKLLAALLAFKEQIRIAKSTSLA
jgi:hypothetical protein